MEVGAPGDQRVRRGQNPPRRTPTPRWPPECRAGLHRDTDGDLQDVGSQLRHTGIGWLPRWSRRTSADRSRARPAARIPSARRRPPPPVRPCTGLRGRCRPRRPGREPGVDEREALAAGGGWVRSLAVRFDRHGACEVVELGVAGPDRKDAAAGVRRRSRKPPPSRPTVAVDAVGRRGDVPQGYGLPHQSWCPRPSPSSPVTAGRRAGRRRRR